MMTDACQYSCQYYCDCTGCGTLSRPKPGDCCAFFSDGAVALSTRPGSYRPTFRPI